MAQIITEQEKKNKIDIKEEVKENKKNEKENERIFESKKDIIFLEEDLDEAENINECQNYEEKEINSLQFFKALHKS